MDRERLNQIIYQVGNDTTPIEMVTTPARLFILISQIQLALRHPDNTGKSAAIAREMAENMTKMVCQFHPEAQELINQGWNTEFDMTREEFETWTEEPSRFPFVNQDDPSRPGAGDQF